VPWNTRTFGFRRRNRNARVTHHFWLWQLIVAMVLNFVVQGLAIAAYAARLAGARSGRVATAISLYNIFATGSRLAQMFYSPMLGALSDRAGFTTPGAYQWQLRLIVFSGTAGAVLGTLAIPTFVMLYMRAIRALERSGSVPKAMLAIFRPTTVASIVSEVKFGVATRPRDLSFRNVPKDILVLNVLVTAVYGSVLYPQAARTAVLSSGLVNGFAAIAFNIVVDPASALITDQTVRGERSLVDVKSLVVGLSGTAVLGLLLSQLLLVPGAHFIELAARAVTGR
jgi:Alternate to MurJ